MYQLQLLAKTIRENQEVLEAALKKDLGKSSFESYATEIGFVLADIRSAIRHLPKWMGAQRVKTPVYLFSGEQQDSKRAVWKCADFRSLQLPGTTFARTADRSDRSRKLCCVETIRADAEYIIGDLSDDPHHISGRIYCLCRR